MSACAECAGWHGPNLFAIFFKCYAYQGIILNNDSGVSKDKTDFNLPHDYFCSVSHDKLSPPPPLPQSVGWETWEQEIADSNLLFGQYSFQGLTIVAQLRQDAFFSLSVVSMMVMQESSQWFWKNIGLLSLIQLIDWLTLYHTIRTFNDPKEEGFGKHRGKRRKCW